MEAGGKNRQGLVNSVRAIELDETKQEKKIEEKKKNKQKNSRINELFLCHIGDELAILYFRPSSFHVRSRDIYVFRIFISLVANKIPKS